MTRRAHRAIVSGLLLAGLPPLVGCPLHFQNEATPNDPPTTFFLRLSSQPDTVFVNQREFSWVGTDVDNDIVAYQFQLVEVDSLYYFSGGQVGESHVVRYVFPRPLPNAICPDDCWSPRDRDTFTRFSDLSDGWYEMRVRAIDRGGAIDDTPALKLFYVFFDDIAPVAAIQNNPRCGRLNGAQSYTFLINGSDVSRNAVTPRSKLEYRVQLRAQSTETCQTHLADPFTAWKRFPDDSNVPVVIGDAPPTQYTDLFPPGCRWTFAVEVRDPAGNRGTDTCEIDQNPN
ncbi:MAG: hypothetical protein ACRDGR_00625 [bacterium]